MSEPIAGEFGDPHACALDAASKDSLDRLGDLQEEAGKALRDAREARSLDEAMRRAEAVLFAAGEPVSAEAIMRAVPDGTDVARVLMQLQRTYRDRGVQLVEIAGKWRFQTAADLSFLFHEHRVEPRKLSKAALETLSIIAYCQPVTRAEIEDIRGVSASKGTIDVLLEAGFVRLRGRRRVAGRPVTYGTTERFLEHFGLASLEHLPGKAEFADTRLLDPQAMDSFSIPRPIGALSGEDALDGSSDDADGVEFTRDFFEAAAE